MKRQTLYNIIAAHYNKNEKEFLQSAKEISRNLALLGEKKLAAAINKVIRSRSAISTSSFNPQMNDFVFSKEQQKLLRILKKGFRTQRVNKVFLHGKPGTGKTLFSLILSNELNLPIQKIKLSKIIDSKLGESIKLIESAFKKGEPSLIFIDEIDSIASVRGRNNDILEISRVLNHLFQLMDSLASNKFLVVATNMPRKIDQAFVRRFDLTLNFDNYDYEDISNIFYKYAHKYEIDVYKNYYSHLSKLFERTYLAWTPSYIKRAMQTSALWLSENESPSSQIVEILIAMQIGDNKKMIKKRLQELKVPIRTINFLVGGKNAEAH